MCTTVIGIPSDFRLLRRVNLSEMFLDASLCPWLCSICAAALSSVWSQIVRGCSCNSVHHWIWSSIRLLLSSCKALGVHLPTNFVVSLRSCVNSLPVAIFKRYSNILRFGGILDKVHGGPAVMGLHRGHNCHQPTCDGC